MGKLTLGWSPMQLRLANKSKVQPIGRVSNLVVDVEGMKNYAYFDVIEFVNGEGSYPALLGIGWANDSMAVIKFKKRVMTFENQYIRVRRCRSSDSPNEFPISHRMDINL